MKGIPPPIQRFLWGCCLSILLVSEASTQEALSAKEAFHKGMEFMGSRRFGDAAPPNWEKAAAYLRHAYATEFTKGDLNWGSEETSVYVSFEKSEAYFRRNVRNALIHALCWLGKNAEREIDRLMEAAMINPPPSARGRLVIPGPTAYFGKAEAASGGRAVANWFATHQKAYGNNPIYWIDRSHYFEGAKNLREQEHALKTGFTLAKANPVRDSNSREASALRSLVMSYLSFLRETERREEAMHLATEAMAGSDCDTVFARAAAEAMVRLLGGRFRPVDPRIWDWLTKRTQWDRVEEKMLGAIFRAGRGEEVHENRRRAEALAEKAPAGRALVMGKVLFAQDFPEHGEMFLREAIKHVPESSHEHRAAEQALERALKRHAEEKR